MTVWFVSAAWQRFAVTRLALAQRARLIGELSERGIEAAGVIVADDENLDIAREFGFETLERPNDQLGRKFNDGIEFALDAGADHVVLIGSDDWVHVDLFDRLPADRVEPDLSQMEDFVLWSESPEAVTGREIAFVDLPTGRMRRCRALGRHGVIPWILPRAAFQPSHGRPIRDSIPIGIDGSLIAGLGMTLEWRFEDPHPLCRVDWKSSTNLNSFEKISRAIGYGPEDSDPFEALEELYDRDLVDLARATSNLLQAAT